jgi:hypothetical protein
MRLKYICETYSIDMKCGGQRSGAGMCMASIRTSSALVRAVVIASMQMLLLFCCW